MIISKIFPPYRSEFGIVKLKVGYRLTCKHVNMYQHLYNRLTNR